MTGRTVRWVLPLLLLVPLGVGVAMAASSSSTASGTVKAVKSKTFGAILVSSKGRTLYRYTIDGKNVNRCTSNAVCNKYWPPLLVKAGVKPTAVAGAKAGKLGTIKARNGMRQVTYAGWPLHLRRGHVLWSDQGTGLREAVVRREHERRPRQARGRRTDAHDHIGRERLGLGGPRPVERGA